MKVCTKCQVEKPESDFFLRDKVTGRLHAQCKLCYKVHRKLYQAQHYATYKDSYLKRAKIRRDMLKTEYRQNMLRYLADKSCVECGESDIRVLELDHLERDAKKFTVSQAVVLGYRWNEVIEEIKKCQILCANCHKKKTALQFNWYKAM